MSTELNYGLQATLDTSFEDTVIRVTEALKTEGFGILTKIDMQATLQKNRSSVLIKKT